MRKRRFWGIKVLGEKREDFPARIDNKTEDNNQKVSFIA